MFLVPGKTDRRAQGEVALRVLYDDGAAARGEPLHAREQEDLQELVHVDHGAARFVDLLDRKVRKDVFHALGVGRLLEGEDLAAALAAGHVERAVHLALQVGLVEGVGGERRHADADRQPLGAGFLVPRQQVPLEPLDDAMRQGLRPFRVPFQQEDAEFVPAEARHRVDLPHGAAQDAGEFLQGDVAGGAREPFVVFREAVDVEPSAG